MKVLLKIWCETDMTPENMKWMIENYKKKFADHGIKIEKVTSAWTK